MTHWSLEMLRMFRHRKQDMNSPTISKVVKVINRKHSYSISLLFLSYLGDYSSNERVGQLVVRNSCEESIRWHLYSKVEFKYIILGCLRKLAEFEEMWSM